VRPEAASGCGFLSVNPGKDKKGLKIPKGKISLFSNPFTGVLVLSND